MATCEVQLYEGAGGVAGGQGSAGAASSAASGTSNTDYGIPFIRMTTESVATFIIRLHSDIQGTTPTDLTAAHSAVFAVKASDSSRIIALSKTLTILDAEDGTLSMTFDGTEDVYPGIWLAACVLKNTAGRVIGTYRCWFEVEPGFTDTAPLNGVGPRTGDIRQAMRDFSAGANVLLGDMEFSDHEIATALHRTVQEFNEMQPPISTLYDPQGLPSKEGFLRGTCCKLLEASIFRFARNEMPYNAGGVAYDDMAKMQPYMALLQSAKQEWQTWAKQLKVTITCSECMGSTGIDYFQGASF